MGIIQQTLKGRAVQPFYDLLDRQRYRRIWAQLRQHDSGQRPLLRSQELALHEVVVQLEALHQWTAEELHNLRQTKKPQ